jgi:hypothetical protein
VAYPSISPSSTYKAITTPLIGERSPSVLAVRTTLGPGGARPASARDWHGPIARFACLRENRLEKTQVYRRYRLLGNDPIALFHIQTRKSEAAGQSCLSLLLLRSSCLVLLIERDCCPFEERRELRRCFELGNRVEFLERARERIGQTPCRPGSKFLDSRIEV